MKLIELVLINWIFLIKLNDLVNCVYLNTTSKSKFEHLTPAQITEPDEDGLWSTLLEEWTIAHPTAREGRIIQPNNYILHPTYNPPSQQNYQPQQNKFIPTANYYFSNRVDNVENIEYERTPQSSSTTQAPVTPNSQLYESFTPLRQNGYQQNMIPSQREISETDLFLLSAIEKLTHRVEYMDQRLKRTEQLLLYVMEGNREHEEDYLRPVCPRNFTKIGETCYFFGTDRGLNWKSASAMCKSLGGQLAELDPLSKQQDVIFSLLNDFKLRGKDFWVGGLNPGLLWIWINSGTPVNPNTNLNAIIPQRKPKIIVQSEATTETLYTSSSTTESKLNETIESSTAQEEKLEREENDVEEKVLHKSTTLKPKIVNDPPKRPGKPTIPDSIEIRGNGRCLRLSYNPSTHTYGYTGIDCINRTNYLCEIKDRTLDNEISRIAKKLKFN